MTVGDVIDPLDAESKQKHPPGKSVKNGDEDVSSGLKHGIVKDHVADIRERSCDDHQEGGRIRSSSDSPRDEPPNGLSLIHI